jgi:hypothetical protein
MALAVALSALGPTLATTPTTPATTAAPPGVAPARIPAPPMTPTAAPPAPSVADHCLPSHDGYLRLRMRGAANMDIDWHDADMQCDGGPRPGERGVRVTFAGRQPHGKHRLRFVFGIAAASDAATARNVPTNVTVIFEGERKLYSTAGDNKCTTDEYHEQSLPDAGPWHRQRISARGFCTAAATAIEGRSVLLLSRFDFAGIVTAETGSAP